MDPSRSSEREHRPALPWSLPSRPHGPCSTAPGHPLPVSNDIKSVETDRVRVDEQTVRTGTRWQWGPDTVVGVEATRQASDAGEAVNPLRLRAVLRF